ncbi:hypothetical protein N181_31035 [Sinorhizobium fredii USDA 205]|nr:hypothetical protein N181_31035 [Sinorhizobium fredii USDA 205]
MLLAVTIAYETRFLPKRFGQGLLRGFPSLFLSVPNLVIGLVQIHIFGFQLGLFRVIEPDSFWATLFAATALADLVEIQVGMLRADVMKDAGNCAADAGIEPFDRIDMDGVAKVFAAGMLHGVTLGIVFANGHERLRLIAHQTMTPPVLPWQTLRHRLVQTRRSE